jgi:hypothetical protein
VIEIGPGAGRDRPGAVQLADETYVYTYDRGD